MSDHHSLSFMNDGGEMGALMRARDWSTTSLGPPVQWAKSLQTMLGVILHSKFPMFIWWGPELLCFYNDAYRPSLGIDGKHPSILGEPARESWPEIWEIIKPLIDQVWTGGDATWSEDQLIPIYRNGRLEDVYWTFSYSRINNDAGEVYGVLVTCVETTDKVLSQQNLKQTVDFLQFSTDAAELGTWEYDPLSGRFKANRRLKEWFGLTADKEIDLVRAIELLKTEDQDRVRKAITAAVDSTIRAPYDIIYTIVDPATQQERIVHARGKAFFNEQDIAYRLSGTLADITEETKARQALQESEENFRRLIQHAPVAMCVLKGVDHVVEIANERMFQLWGKPPEQVMKRPIFQGLPDAQGQGLEELLDNVFRTGERFVAQERPVMLDRENGKETVYQNFLYEPFFGADGSIAGVIAASVEVTEQVLARQRIEAAEERARLAVEAGQLGMFDHDMVNDVTITSDRIFEILDAPPESDRHQIVANIHPADREVRIQALKDSVRTGRLDYEVRVLRKNGTTNWIKAEGKMMYDSEGRARRLVGTLVDITEKKLADQLREEYIAIASHELRNPLTSLKLSLELLSASLREPDKLKLADKAKSQVQRIMTMTDELLNVSKISSGILELRPEIVNLQDCIRESITTFQGGAERNPIAVIGQADIAIKADKFRVEQVLINLISNASKYSPKGADIAIEVNREPEHLRIAVKDYGIGIAADKLPGVFKKFSRIEADHITGYGLGLYISDQIVRRHGGEMGVESEKGKGSTFWFTLPL